MWGDTCELRLGQAHKNLQSMIPRSHFLFPSHASLCRVPENGRTIRCKKPGSLNHHFKDSNGGVPWDQNHNHLAVSWAIKGMLWLQNGKMHWKWAITGVEGPVKSLVIIKVMVKEIFEMVLSTVKSCWEISFLGMLQQITTHWVTLQKQNFVLKSQFWSLVVPNQGVVPLASEPP